MKAAPRDATMPFGQTALLTPHSGVRIPASPGVPGGEEAANGDDERTVFDFEPFAQSTSAEVTRVFAVASLESEEPSPPASERTRMGLFIVPSEPRTEPHLPVADPFEVAEQLAGIESSEIPPSGTRTQLFRDVARPSALVPGVEQVEHTLCSAGVVRESHVTEVEVVSSLQPGVRMELSPATADGPQDQEDVTRVQAVAPLAKPRGFGWVVGVAEWILCKIFRARIKRS